MPITINVKKPEGNAFCIMGTVSSILKQCGRRDEIPEVMARMKSGDYDNLCDVAEEVTHGTLKITGRKKRKKNV